MTRVVINVITTLTNIHFMFNTTNLNIVFFRKKNNSNTYVTSNSQRIRLLEPI